MKEVINLQGEKEMVNINTAVKTVNGIHYRLTQAEIDARLVEESARVARSLAALPKQLRKATEETTLTVDGVEYECNTRTVMVLLGLLRMLEELNDPAHEVLYKAENGFFSRNLAQLKTTGMQVGNRMNKAFAAEKLTREEVANGTITTEDQLRARFAGLVEDYET